MKNWTNCQTRSANVKRSMPVSNAQRQHQMRSTRVKCTAPMSNQLLPALVISKLIPRYLIGYIILSSFQNCPWFSKWDWVDLPKLHSPKTTQTCNAWSRNEAETWFLGGFFRFSPTSFSFQGWKHGFPGCISPSESTSVFHLSKNFLKKVHST